MKRMCDAGFVFHGSGCSNKRLANNLAAINPLPAFRRGYASKQVNFYLFEIQEIEEVFKFLFHVFAGLKFVAHCGAMYLLRQSKRNSGQEPAFKYQAQPLGTVSVRLHCFFTLSGNAAETN